MSDRERYREIQRERDTQRERETEREKSVCGRVKLKRLQIFQVAKKTSKYL